ncbi:MAG TPA: c-type cytochrome, partial [bacterium]|nr:c-type cytochrome [bacterium]
MSIRTLGALAMLIAGTMFSTACQPQVSVSRSGANLQEGLPLEPAAESMVPVRPSAIEGSKVFAKAQCVICHGKEGLGDGPSAANLTAEQKTLLHDLLRLVG